MVFDDLKAVGEYVVLKGVKVEDKTEEKKTKSGIILPSETASANEAGQRVNTSRGKVRVKHVVYSIGSAVDKTKYDLKEGDEVIINDYDAHSFQDDEENIYTVCKASNVQLVVKFKD